MTDPIDQALHDAFQSRHVPHDIRPSLIDVRWRARRRHTRRNAALVGCAAITGAGAVAVLASRHPGEQTDVGVGAGESVTPTTMACYSVSTVSGTMTMPPTTIGTGIYTISDGDLPLLVAQKFNITIEELDAANRGVPGYDTFYVGLQITIPSPTTPTIAPVPFDPCEQGSEWTWHCTDQVGTDEFGRDVFLSCEQQFTGFVATTTPAAVLPTVSTVEVPSPTTTGTIPVEGVSTTTSLV
jgi:hypothetical protein